MKKYSLLEIDEILISYFSSFLIVKTCILLKLEHMIYSYQLHIIIVPS